MSLRDAQRSGTDAYSPDGKLFAWIAQVVNVKKYVVEVHSLETGNVKTSALLDSLNYRDIRFSPDSKQVLVGTRDTVEILDIENSKWQKPVSLTPPKDRVVGKTVSRPIPIGLGGFPGSLYTSLQNIVYSKPAALAKFDISPTGMIAVGSEVGEIVLASLETRDIVAKLGSGERILGGKTEMIDFTPTAGHLLAYADGVLHIFKLGKDSQVINVE